MQETTSATSGPVPMPLWFGPLMVFAGGVCIGFAPIGLRLGLEGLGPQAIAFWRYSFALPILFCLVLVTQRRLPGRINPYIVLAGTCFALDIGLWHLALTHTSVANATFIVNLGNVGVGLVAWVFLKERPTAIWGIAVVLAVCGAAALTLGGPGAGQALTVEDAAGQGLSIPFRGELLAFAAAFLVSGYMLGAKLARRTLGGLEAIFWLTVVEIVVAAGLVAASGESFWPDSPQGFIAPLFLALIVQVAGQGLIVTGLGHTPAAIAGILVVVQPVIAAAISWRLFNEPLLPLQGFGAVLILVAIVISQRPPRQAPSKVSQDGLKTFID